MGFNVVHRHLLANVPGGSTRVWCEESMAGPLLTLIYGEAKLRTALETWPTALTSAAER